MTFWIAIIGASIIAFGLKFAGYTVPPAVLEKPRVSRVTTLLPAAVALLLRAPFLVVVIAAAATAAGLRMLGLP